MTPKQKFDKSAFTISGCGSRGIVYRLAGVPAWLKLVASYLQDRSQELVLQRRLDFQMTI
jgi:hypothetical protein